MKAKTMIEMAYEIGFNSFCLFTEEYIYCEVMNMSKAINHPFSRFQVKEFMISDFDNCFYITVDG